MGSSWKFATDPLAFPGTPSQNPSQYSLLPHAQHPLPSAHLRFTSTTQPPAPRMQSNSERMSGCVVAVHHKQLKQFGVHISMAMPTHQAWRCHPIKNGWLCNLDLPPIELALSCMLTYFGACSLTSICAASPKLPVRVCTSTIWAWAQEKAGHGPPTTHPPSTTYPPTQFWLLF